MSIDPEEKTGMLGCLAALAAIGAVIGGVVWLSQQDFSSLTEAGTDTAKTAKGSGTALTRVGPVREKTVVKKAAPVVPLARKVNTDDTTAENTGRAGGVTAAVRDLGSLTEESPNDLPESSVAYDRILDATPLCYHGRIARRAPSLFTRQGFAITYGADDYNTGDPLPRLEIFLSDPQAPLTASYLSMTHRTFADFPAGHEVPIDRDEAAISAVIAKWIATVATETCPDAAPAPAPDSRDRETVPNTTADPDAKIVD